MPRTSSDHCTRPMTAYQHDPGGTIEAVQREGLTIGLACSS